MSNKQQGWLQETWSYVDRKWPLVIVRDWYGAKVKWWGPRRTLWGKGHSKLFFWHMISLGSPGWPGTHHIVQALIHEGISWGRSWGLGVLNTSNDWARTSLGIFTDLSWSSHAPLLWFFVCFLACFRVCTWIFCVCVYLCTTGTPGPSEVRRRLWSLRTAVTAGCEPPYGRWESNPSPLEEQQAC